MSEAVYICRPRFSVSGRGFFLAQGKDLYYQQLKHISQTKGESSGELEVWSAANDLSAARSECLHKFSSDVLAIAVSPIVPEWGLAHVPAEHREETAKLQLVVAISESQIAVIITDMKCEFHKLLKDESINLTSSESSGPAFETKTRFVDLCSNAAHHFCLWYQSPTASQAVASSADLKQNALQMLVVDAQSLLSPQFRELLDSQASTCTLDDGYFPVQTSMNCDSLAVLSMRHKPTLRQPGKRKRSEKVYERKVHLFRLSGFAGSSTTGAATTITTGTKTATSLTVVELTDPSLEREVEAVAVDATGARVCVCDSWGALHWWEVSGARGAVVGCAKSAPLFVVVQKTRSHWHNAPVCALAWNYTGGETLAGGEQSRLVAWDLTAAAAAQRRSWLLPDGPLLHLTTAPSALLATPFDHDRLRNRVLATTATNKIYLVDTATAAARLVRAGPPIPVLYPQRFSLARWQQSVGDTSVHTLLRNQNCETLQLDVVQGAKKQRLRPQLCLSHRCSTRCTGHDASIRLLRVDDDATACGDNTSYITTSPVVTCLDVRPAHTWSRFNTAAGTLVQGYPNMFRVTAAAALSSLNMIVLAGCLGAERKVCSLQVVGVLPGEGKRTVANTTLVAEIAVFSPALTMRTLPDQEDAVQVAFENGDVCTYKVEPIETELSLVLKEKRNVGQQRMTLKEWRTQFAVQFMA
ncbi:hypothetical protein GNI_142010 [Gregarina niphandrodes]|uniref:Uncharacterized protein n=1 Tax=Gregarina niphandrodes TaxID=110365 RepID=A0A023B0W6_GRENI|nr:hypothetical protein GNI_142010 [Gregarina niphandrodes]EZG44981.1 hypothetical protein GNI_142010 [Gregarina niphandrodes]|eukprot:XP_011132607.1 hypothetical protein GNI_142010 [Gregarina niphandrodes]